MRRLVSSAALAALVFAAAAGTGIAQEGPDEVAPPAHDVYGTVLGVRGDTLSLQLRTGRTLYVDLREARALQHVVLLTRGRPVHVRGNPGVRAFHAVAVLKSHIGPASWPPDN